tara:strand:+ start:371 stop:502 length:132 start_codon:yes stop_codon:yes gene_type:complete
MVSPWLIAGVRNVAIGVGIGISLTGIQKSGVLRWAWFVGISCG